MRKSEETEKRGVRGGARTDFPCAAVNNLLYSLPLSLLFPHFKDIFKLHSTGVLTVVGRRWV